jgi:chromate reductase
MKSLLHYPPELGRSPFGTAYRTDGPAAFETVQSERMAAGMLVAAKQGDMKMNKINILGIVGSLRKDSYNAFALKAAQELLPEGAVLDTVHLRGMPVFNQDDEMAPPAVVLEFKEKILAADAILFATPEYNYSIPGGLKNAIDWASRPSGQSAWKGKTAAIMGVSIGNFGTARAQYDLRKILVALDMPVVVQPEVMIGNAADKFDQNGALTDERSRQLIKKLLNTLLRLEKSSRLTT